MGMLGFLLAKTLVAVTTRMEPANGAHVLSDALHLAKDAYQRMGMMGGMEMSMMGWMGGSDWRSLVDGLVLLAGRMEPADASRVLSQTLARETDAGARASLAAGLAAVATPIELADLARGLTESLARAKDAEQRPQRIPMSVGGWRRGSAVPPRRWTRRKSPMSVDRSRRTWPTPSPQKKESGDRE